MDPASAGFHRGRHDRKAHGRFPGGDATVRLVREAGWGNAMRFMLTGDHWSADESYRMGVTQQIAPTAEAALATAIAMAQKIASCGPLGIKATLASSHQLIDPVEADVLSKLGARIVPARAESRAATSATTTVAAGVVR
jgi:enoyl-CoA hydratase/carnithine racemase